MKLLKWTIFNGLFVVALYFALADGVVWCGNVVKFIIWLNAILIPFCFWTEESKQKIRDNTVVSQHMDGVFDGSIVLALAANGWFLYAGLSVFSFVMLHALRYGPESSNSITGE